MTTINPVLTRDFINPNIVLDDSGSTYDIDYIRDATNYWKIILREKYKLQKGNTICIFDSSIRVTYVALFFAAVELGLILITPPEKATDDSGRTSRLDLMIGSKGIDFSIINDDTFHPELIAMATYYSKTVAYYSIYDTYTIQDHDLYSQLATTVDCEPDDVVYIGTSSGTTGTPKMIQYTHRQLYHICQRNAQGLGFKNQSVCHIRNLHHASVIMIAFLPTIHQSDFHYIQIVSSEEPTHDIKKLVSCIIKNKISKIVIPYKRILDMMFDHMVEDNIKFTHEIDFYVAGFLLTPNYVNLVSKTGVTTLTSMFGSNETLGPLFLKTINASTDLEKFEIRNIGNPMDDFFVLELKENQLHVSCNTLYPNVHILGDSFSIRSDGGFKLEGRIVHHRINEIDFSINAVIKVVKRSHPGEFDVVVDEDYQQIYLVSWDGPINLSDVNKEMISEFGRVEFSSYKILNRADFQHDFKIDFEFIRELFRKEN
jgi:acyl-coenzyme A synthetase/AMP-(fatty) acid ligase